MTFHKHYKKATVLMYHLYHFFHFSLFLSVLRIRIRIHMFLVLLDLDPDPDPFINKQIRYSKKNLDFYCFVTSFCLLNTALQSQSPLRKSNLFEALASRKKERSNNITISNICHNTIKSVDA
jgi:hypothetical protein